MRALLLPVWLCIIPSPHATRCDDIQVVTSALPSLVDPAECVHR
ncbi:hypothetical protein ACHAWF_016307 [Thalassiosira exigua]